MFTIRAYFEIFVMKFRGERSSEIGIRSRRVRTLGKAFFSIMSTYPFVLLYHEPTKLGSDASVNLPPFTQFFSCSFQVCIGLSLS